MNVLVTGAPGWLGTELVRQLEETEHPVRCLVLDDVDASELANFDVQLFRGDVRERDSLDDVFDGGVDTVFHCAGLIHPTELFGVSDFFETNADGTENVLDAARTHGAEHFVYVSSNAAQGFNDTSSTLMTESMPCQPENKYGESKYAAEQHVRRYESTYGLTATIVRPCWYYGPRQPERMNRLMRMIRSGNPLIFGDGTNLRSMTYVPSLAEALLLIAENRSQTAGETYWAADRQPYTTNYIYRTIAELLNTAEELKPIYVPKPVPQICRLIDQTLGNLGIYEQNVHVAGEMHRDIACDSSKLREHVGWTPPRDLTDGMRRGVEWAVEHGHL